MPKSTRERILSATEKLCAKEGPDKVTLDGIAAEAKVGKGTIYTYFGNKEELFEHVISERIVQLRERVMQSLLVSDRDYKEKLVMIASDIDDFVFGHQILFLMSFFLSGKLPVPGEEDTGPMGMITSLFDGLVKPLICVGVERGEVRNDIPPIVLSWFFHGMMFLSGRIRTDPEGRKVTKELLFDLFMNGAASLKEPESGNTAIMV
ncbi:MAG: TetR/AcrR family transcriptional regulator [Sphaerochaetaceae bacterium]|nr:TetR/AcrR family transcriptional regulator [Sphaerochaetaceae bacterium]